MASVLAPLPPFDRVGADGIPWRALGATVILAEALGSLGLASATLAWIVIWAQASSRREAFGLALLFFLVAGREVPWMVDAIGQGTSLGAFLWLLHALILAAPWAMLHLGGRASPGIALRVAAVLAITLLLPPWAIVQWGHPITAAGELFPGSGWLGLAVVVGVGLALASFARGAIVPWAKAIALFAVALCVTCQLHYAPPPMPRGWVAIDTTRPTERAEACTPASLAVSSALTRRAHAELVAGAKVIVLPEGAAGIWTMCEAYWWRELNATAQDLGATVLVGALRPTCLESPTKCLVPGEAKATSYTNSLVVLGASAAAINARVPVPVLSWHPWRVPGHVRAHAGIGVHSVAGRRVAVLFCYEEMVPSLALVSFIASRPEVLVTVANHWWAHPRMTRPATQGRFSQSIARLFGVPLLRASNLPSGS